MIDALETTLSPGGVVRETPKAGAGMSPAPASPGLLETLDAHRCHYRDPPVSRRRPAPAPKATPVEAGSLEERVLLQLRSNGGRQGYTYLHRAMGVSTNTLRTVLERMVAAGQVRCERVRGGRCWVVPDQCSSPSM